jgi:hypothetical protein
MTPDEYAQYQLNVFYGPSWLNRDTTLDQFQYSGYVLGEKINIAERVIHVDCGNNPFRNMVSNLTGIDPYNPSADHVMSVDQYAYSYKSNKFNVAFLLGAVNFGTKQDVQDKLAATVGLLRNRDSRMYFRCYTVPPAGAPDDFFSWDYNLQVEFANLFEFDIVEMETDTHDTIYAEWLSRNRARW